MLLAVGNAVVMRDGCRVGWAVMVQVEVEMEVAWPRPGCVLLRAVVGHVPKALRDGNHF